MTLALYLYDLSDVNGLVELALKVIEFSPFWETMIIVTLILSYVSMSRWVTEVALPPALFITTLMAFWWYQIGLVPDVWYLGGLIAFAGSMLLLYFRR